MRSKDQGPMQRIKEFCEEYYLAHNQSPSCICIGKEFGITRNTAYRYLVEMREKGLIDYEKGSIHTEKTKSSTRTIRINDELVDLLLAMKDKQIQSKYIFPSPETGDVRDTSAVTRKLHRIQERAGLPKIRFHDLRHTFATLTLEAGVDVKTVSHMLGHTDAGFTMNTYMHVTDDMQKNAADKMKNLIENSGKDTKVIQFPA